MMLREAAEHGLLVKLRCSIDVYGDQPLFDFRLACSRDGTDAYVNATYRWPEAGDYGHLEIRRPGAVITTQTWRTVKLGDPG